MAYRGGATFAWVSDYSQFYLIDVDHNDTFQAPIEREIVSRDCFVPETGLVVYTADCLQQHIRIAIHDSEPAEQPVEPMSGQPWTLHETVEVRFPSRRFTLSSPSYPGSPPGGPVFHVDAERLIARIAWKQFDGSRDDSVPVEPDVIQIELWPARG
jgi:hypothetical protein